MPSMLQLSFWEDERKFLWEFFNELLFDTMLAGASNGLPLLPAAIRPLVSWETVNESALAFLRTYRSDILDSIEAVSEKQARVIIEEWARSGATMDVLKNDLAPIFGTTRARSIAATEVTRMFAAGNQMLWQSTGVIEAKVWQTARDEMVCPLCGPLHNQVVGLQSNFVLTPGQLADTPQMKAMQGDRYTQEAALQKAGKLLSSVGQTAPYPPYHPNCRCWIKPVVSLEMVEQRIGDVLAQRFFAELVDGRYPQVAYYG